MDVIREFDPWKSPLCTCPKKYSLNPYTGCSFSCIYCYITGFIKDAFKVRAKKDIIKRVKRDIKRMDKNLFVSMSNSSDPYPYIERNLYITREILKLFREEGVRVLIVTKSDLVKRDIDILKDMNVAVSITITTFKEVYKKIEPFAPPPERRLEAIKILYENGIPVILRLDPIIPFVNDDEDSIKEVIKKTSLYIKQVITSTLKPRRDSLKRFKENLPDIYPRLKALYIESFHGSFYLPKNIRLKLITMVREITRSYNLDFSSCREGFPELNTKSCDGSDFIDRI
ncbi:MAG TPA: radical SAM protein [Thermodesulfobacterium geofontis]|nr:radical SAM protein [Thermodesulfobacterium geofontis]